MFAYKHLVFLGTCFLWLLPLSASQRVAGDGIAPASFSFAINQHAFERNSRLFFVAANETGGFNYALSVASPAKNFSGIAPEKITHNGEVNKDNPLYNQKINHLALSELNPVAVTESDQTSLHLLSAFLSLDNSTMVYTPRPDMAKLLSATTLNDAEGNVTAGIVGIAASPQHVYAAVKKNGGTFGEVGGGIALVSARDMDKKNATTGASGNLAVALDPTTPAVKITSDLASITANMVDMHYDEHIGRLYIALQVTAGAGASDGARAVVVGRLENGILYLDPIAPDGALSGTDKIVGATGSGAEVSIFKVRTLQTSSRLSYLIVEGNNGTSGGPDIFALPLVDKKPEDQRGSSQHGALAKFDGDPTDKYSNNYPHALLSRGLLEPASDPGDLLTNASTQARVGAGPLPLGSSQVVTDIFARNDGVYVSIGDAFDGTTTPGAFYSQAILDHLGRVKAWTPWERAAGTDDQLFGIALDQQSGNMWLMSGDSATTVTVVQRTLWSDAGGDGLLGGTPVNRTIGLVDQLSTELPKEQGGIHNLFTFSHTTPGFGSVTTTTDNQLSMAVAVGLGKVVLAETGRNGVASQFRANTGDFATGKQTFTDGSLTGFVADGTAKIVSIEGNVVGQIGPLTSAEVSRTPLSGSTTNGYVFIGGVNGVAVLSEADGSGWDTSSPNGGLHAGFVGLTSTMSFKQLGSYTNVRKLVSDGTYLYVLTTTVLDRISIASIASGPLTVVRLADLYQLGLTDRDSFSDVIVSHKLGLLATGAGLYRVANDFTIADAALTSGGLGWTNVGLPEGFINVTRLLAVSPTGFENGFATGGMVYVLGGSVSFGQARIYRFFVEDVSSTAISDTTVRPLNDLYIRNTPSFFVEIGSYRNFIATEGTAILNEVSGDQVNGPLLFDFSPLQAGDRHAAKNGNRFIGALPVSPASSIRQLLRNTASGSWLAAGGRGLFVNE